MVPIWSSSTDPNHHPHSPLKPISDYRRTFVVLTILLLQLALLSTSRLSISATTPTALATIFRLRTPGEDSPSSDSDIRTRSAVVTAPPTKPPRSASPSPPEPASWCPLGRIYVYDLPATFNADLVAGCEDLNPWTSRCAALSNHGFGTPLGDDHLLRPTPIVPPDLTGAWYATDQFAGEVIYHARVLQHPCRTLDPDDEAVAAFYIPFYAGLAVGKYLWSSSPTSIQSASASARDRDRHCEMLLSWIRQQKPWQRSGGADHFLMLGRITWDFRRSHDPDWGGSFLYMPGMENVTRLLIERNPWDTRDIGVPYPTGFHPRRRTGGGGSYDDDVTRWLAHVLSRNRTTLFSFAGAARSGIKNDFRSLLLAQCADAGAKCRSVDWKSAAAAAHADGNRSEARSVAGAADRTRDTLALFLDSQFCLQPRGDSFTRRSIFDCMIAGAIPVFFWRRSAYVQYEWFLPPPAEDWSVFIDRTAVRNGSVVISQELERLGQEKIDKMRRRVVQLIPRLVYALPGGGENRGRQHGGDHDDDAFEVAIQGVLRRFRDKRAATATAEKNPLRA